MSLSLILIFVCLNQLWDRFCLSLYVGIFFFVFIFVIFLFNLSFFILFFIFFFIFALTFTFICQLLWFFSDIVFIISSIILIYALLTTFLCVLLCIFCCSFRSLLFPLINLIWKRSNEVSFHFFFWISQIFWSQNAWLHWRVRIFFHFCWPIRVFSWTFRRISQYLFLLLLKILFFLWYVI